MKDNIINQPNLKLVLLGNSGSGKTTLVYWFKWKKCVAYAFDNTIGASFNAHNICVNDNESIVPTHIWDTAGQERYKSLVNMYCRDSQAAFIVFSVMDAHSFKSIKEWITYYTQNNNCKSIIFLIANKIDYAENLWSVHRNEIIDFCKEHDLQVFYTSGYTGENVNHIFSEIAHQVSKLHPHLLQTQTLSTSAPAFASTINVANKYKTCDC